MFQPDPFITTLLPLCDGTRNPASLIVGMVEAHRRGRFQIHANNEPVSKPEKVRQVIAGLCVEVIGKLRNIGIIIETKNLGAHRDAATGQAGPM
jgi:hypothetical protein